MLLILACMFAAAAAAPTTYDQRQDGEFNVRADVQNIVFLVAIPPKLIPDDVFDILMKSSKHTSRENAQERADIQVMEAFVEPSTPYRVVIGENGVESDRSAESDGRTAEVVIAGRRRADMDLQSEQDEYKDLATEQRADTVSQQEEAPKETEKPKVVPDSLIDSISSTI